MYLPVSGNVNGVVINDLECPHLLLRTVLSIQVAPLEFILLEHSLAGVLFEETDVDIVVVELYLEGTLALVHRFVDDLEFTSLNVSLPDSPVFFVGRYEEFAIF